ncbi:hypothetical protein J8M21_12335 [Pseudoalteromonas luteoviolacea]|uniref:hypothetical protein n=1 Tax=Pseudoalteromonas luteoviolacea TaxID=43657 RepID=UPI001B3A1D05|nr:hypothetical protein [Pseudoalteromonas luteoviolacea]MBQ4877995.1 hypothetical protein [Pseudoalteromonas luteoviolacea]MBQ4907151.1 hypothetical protein [Pseudoalteromonas luteoviolacea]
MKYRNRSEKSKLGALQTYNLNHSTTLNPVVAGLPRNLYFTKGSYVAKTGENF